MRCYTFQTTLLASIRVKGETRSQSELKLRNALASADANLGMVDDRPIVAAIEIEGSLDLIDVVECDE